MDILLNYIVSVLQIKTCDILCQRHNHKLKKTTTSLHPIPVKSEVWKQHGMDFIGPLHPTPRGNRYIMSLIIIRNGLRHTPFMINLQLLSLIFFTRLEWNN